MNHPSNLKIETLLFPNGFIGVLQNLPFAMWPFAGLECGVLAGEEVTNPSRTVAKGLLYCRRIHT